eukprot:COSAG02_NODE_9436_length_2218_cov_1.492213_1_plen_89_part_00
MLRLTRTLPQKFPPDTARLATLLAQSAMAHAFTKEAMIRMSARVGRATGAALGWLVLEVVTEGTVNRSMRLPGVSGSSEMSVHTYDHP